MKGPHEIVLIAKSDKIRSVLSERLHAAGFDLARTFPDTESYSASTPGEPPELLIMDVDSGGVPDLPLIEAARRIPLLRSAKLMVITRSRDLDTLDVALGGIDGVLVIPFGMQLFVETVAEHLGEEPPSLPEQAGGGHVAAQEHPHPRPESVLVVDDSASMRHIVREYLGRMGFSQIDCAANFKEADELLASKHFGLILSDLKMPGRSGMELLDRVRKDPAHADTPFVLITSDSRVENAFAAGRMGATAFLPKPFTIEDMEKVLGFALSR